MINLKKWCSDNHKEYILDEWNGFYTDSFSNKTSPSKVNWCSSELARWKCSRCGNLYLQTVNRRVEEKEISCIDCKTRDRVLSKNKKLNNPRLEKMELVKSLQTSLPEQYIYFYLKPLFEDIERGKRFQWLGRSSLDIYIPSLQFAIEFDGKYWHDSKNESDASKSRLCFENGVYLYRIQEGNIKTSDKYATIILYNNDSSYTNIGDAINELITLINEKYGKEFSQIAVDIYYDADEIRRSMREQFGKKTIAYLWPEIWEYWDYEKNSEISPDNLTRNINMFVNLKCPHCGKSYRMKPRYYARSMLQCQCEMTPNINTKYYEFAKSYYEKYGTIEFDDDSLLARRAYDFFTRVKKYHLIYLPQNELRMLGNIGIFLPKGSISQKPSIALFGRKMENEV